MVLRLCVATLAFAAMAVAANVMEGTWKLDPSKSTTTGMPKMKEGTVTWMPDGSNWRYRSKGIRETGEAIETTYVYVKDGEEIKLDGSPLADALVLNGATKNVAEGVFKRGGKNVGKVKRTLSADGKTMTLVGNSVLADGKAVSYTSVYNRQ